MSLPPAHRTPAVTGLAGVPVDGGLRLQRCTRCHAVQYPPRERCGECLADALDWQVVPGEATLLAASALAHSLDSWFSARLPWHVASLRLDAGPVVFAHLLARDASPGDRLRVANARDGSGAGCLVAFAGDPDSLHEHLQHLGISA